MLSYTVLVLSCDGQLTPYLTIYYYYANVLKTFVACAVYTVFNSINIDHEDTLTSINRDIATSISFTAAFSYLILVE